MIYGRKYNSPVGGLTMGTDGQSLVGLWFDNQKNFGGKYKNEIVYTQENLKIFKDVSLWLDKYFAGAKPKIDFPLRLEGTDFQNKVWQKLKDIPYGTTVSYKELARRLNQDKVSCQAVGGAVGKNPICIIVPCHRVIGADGALKGYAAGLEKKEYLLRLEGAFEID